MPEPLFFPTPADWRAWLEANHEAASEILVGFHKKGSGRPSITWPEAVDQALCFGWIDGIRRRIDEKSYTIRFTPRKQRSHWSAINVARVAELRAAGLMTPAGLRAFEARRDELTAQASYERTTPAELAAEYDALLRANAAAAGFFDTQPPWYRRAVAHWVMSAKKEETQRRRLAQLIECSAEGRTVPPLTRPSGGGASSS